MFAWKCSHTGKQLNLLSLTSNGRVQWQLTIWFLPYCKALVPNMTLHFRFDRRKRKCKRNTIKKQESRVLCHIFQNAWLFNTYIKANTCVMYINKNRHVTIHRSQITIISNLHIFFFHLFFKHHQIIIILKN